MQDEVENGEDGQEITIRLVYVTPLNRKELLASSLGISEMLKQTPGYTAKIPGFQRPFEHFLPASMDSPKLKKVR